MKKITDTKTGEIFMGEVWIAEIKDGKRELKVELKTENDVDRYEVEDVPEEKKYGGRVREEGDTCWYIDEEGDIIEDYCWMPTELQLSIYEAGNMFWTKEEAEKELARRKAHIILKEDTKGFKPDWEKYEEEKFTVYFSYTSHTLCVGHTRTGKYTDICFKSNESAWASVEAHRQLWLDYLGIEEENGKRRNEQE